MSFTKIVKSILLLSAALQGSSAAALPGRRLQLRDEQGNTAVTSKDLAMVAARSDEMGDLIARAPQGVEVPESDMLQLIDDVRAVELQMQEWLDGVTVSEPTSALDDVVPPIESVDPIGDLDQPGVSDPSPDELTNTIIGDPLGTDAAAPTEDGDREAPSDTGCMMTVTQTFTEFIFNGPTSEESGFRGGNETGSVDVSGSEASPTASVPLDGALDSTALTPSGGEPDISPVESTFEDEMLLPFALSEDLDSLPTSSLADLWESAAPSITPPPAVTDDPILDDNEVSGDEEIDLLSEEQEEEEDTVEAVDALDDGVEGTEGGEFFEEGDDDDQVVPPPTEMTLRFPGEGDSGIEWRTISLPSV